MSYRGLGFDPTPGSVDAVEQTVARLRAAAEALSSVDDAVAAAGRHSASWEGAAADAFRARLSAPAAPTGHVTAAIPVLEQWAAALAANQRRTEELDATAVRLRRALDDARDALQDKQNALDLASTPAVAAVASVDVATATSRVAEAEAALAAVLAEARDLARTHERAANEAADALDPGAAPDRHERPAIRALAGFLDRSSRASAAIAGLVTPYESPIRAPGGPPISILPAGTDSSGASAFAAALAAAPRGTGELIVLGETRLSQS